MVIVVVNEDVVVNVIVVISIWYYFVIPVPTAQKFKVIKMKERKQVPLLKIETPKVSNRRFHIEE